MKSFDLWLKDNNSSLFSEMQKQPGVSLENLAEKIDQQVSQVVFRELISMSRGDPKLAKELAKIISANLKVMAQDVVASYDGKPQEPSGYHN